MLLKIHLYIIQYKYNIIGNLKCILAYSIFIVWFLLKKGRDFLSWIYLDNYCLFY